MSVSPPLDTSAAQPAAAPASAATDGPSAAVAGSPPPAEADRRLLDALRAYVDDRVKQGAVEASDRPHYTLVDRAWVLALLACVVLAANLLPGGLLPERFFGDERYKAYSEQFITWLFTAVLLRHSLTSPETLLALTRRRSYQIGVVSVLAACLIAMSPIVRIDAIPVPPETRIFVDNRPQPAHFRERLRSLQVRLQDPNADNARTVTLSVWAMLRSGLHVTPDWRLHYPVTFNCGPGQCPVPSTVEVTLTNGTFDPEFEERLRQSNVTVTNSRTAFVSFGETITGHLDLLAGLYSVKFRAGQCSRLLPSLSVPTDGTYDISIVCE
jgi:hypothetical protein